MTTYQIMSFHVDSIAPFIAPSMMAGTTNVGLYNKSGRPIHVLHNYLLTPRSPAQMPRAMNILV